jgi:hypothetical protein
MNLPYLEYVDGIFPTDPVDLETLNLEMWPLKQIYCLRSDLISLILVIGNDDGKIVRWLHMSEIRKSLKHDRLKISPIAEREILLTHLNIQCEFTLRSNSNFWYFQAYHPISMDFHTISYDIYNRHNISFSVTDVMIINIHIHIS